MMCYTNYCFEKVLEYFYHLGWRPDPNSNLIFYYITNGFKDICSGLEKYYDIFSKGYTPDHEIVKYLSSIGFSGDGVLELSNRYDYMNDLITLPNNIYISDPTSMSFDRTGYFNANIHNFIIVVVIGIVIFL